MINFCVLFNVKSVAVLQHFASSNMLRTLKNISRAPNYSFVLNQILEKRSCGPPSSSRNSASEAFSGIPKAKTYLVT